MKNLQVNDILIRNLDGSFLYWKEKDDEVIKKYEAAKKKLSDDKENSELQKKVEALSKKVFTFGQSIELSKKNNRYFYSGAIPDSLMNRQLRKVIGEKAINTVANVDYTEAIINLKFKSDVIIQTDEYKQRYDPDIKEIKTLPEKKSKKLISRQKLRKIAYKEGVTINGVHYVNFQRSSSKARTGSDIFIDERYFQEMESWQTMGIPFRENFAEKEKIDIVSTRSYESLTSSSIIGTLDIDPDSILLIDEVDGTASQPCNVVTLNPDTKRLQVSKEDYEKHVDLWDGQSLADESIFESGMYWNRKMEKMCNYSDKGFLLLRNHFFKSAVFNTKLQKYYHEKFENVDNPVIYDRFGQEYNPYNIKIVTTKNSIKILKFADVVVNHMVSEEKKERLIKLEEDAQVFRDKCSRMKNNVSSAKRKFTIELKKSNVGIEEIQKAEKELERAKKEYDEQIPDILLELKKREKLVKLEQERLTWEWYKEKLKDDKSEFGVCKYEKTSKYGNRQQLWYQILNSLNLNEDQLWKILEPQVHEINLMKNYPAFFKNHLNTKAADSDNIGERMMKEILQVNEDVTRTRWYKDYRRSYLKSILEHLYAGKVQLSNSDFCTLVSCPYEMLQASAGEKIETSILSDFQCYCSRYKDGEELYGFRSPHIAIGENAILKNTYRPEWKWFNFTDRILIINLFGNGAFLTDVWGGA